MHAKQIADSAARIDMLEATVSAMHAYLRKAALRERPCAPHAEHDALRVSHLAGGDALHEHLPGDEQLSGADLSDPLRTIGEVAPHTMEPGRPAGPCIIPGDPHAERSADPVEDPALHDHPESGAALRDDVEAVLRDHSGAALRYDLVRQDSCDEALADDLEPWLFDHDLPQVSAEQPEDLAAGALREDLEPHLEAALVPSLSADYANHANYERRFREQNASAESSALPYHNPNEDIEWRASMFQALAEARLRMQHGL